MAKASNWTTVAESKSSWERDALDFLHGQFPAHDPDRAWANFEFIAAFGKGVIWKRGQVQFAGTARRVLRTKGS